MWAVVIHKDLQPYGTEFDSCTCQVFFRHVTEHTALYFVINRTIPLLIVLFSFYYIYFLHVTNKRTFIINLTMSL